MTHSTISMATPRRRVLLVGSSIMEQWSATAALLPGAHVVNRAVGGTLTAYWVEHLATVLVEEQPDAIGIYCGSNDLNQDVPAAGIIANHARCRAIMRHHNPALPCAYFSIIKAPQKLGRWDVIDAINAAVRAQQPAGDLYLELNDVLCPANQPVAPFFIDDGLHMTPAAYAALNAYCHPALAAWRTRRLV